MSQLEALALSILIESAVAAFLCHRWGLGGPRGWLLGIEAAALGTVLTHPGVWHGVLWASPRVGYATAVAVAEVGAFLVEAVFYRALGSLSWRDGLRVSLAANAASFGFGLFLYAVGWA